MTMMNDSSPGTEGLRCATSETTWIQGGTPAFRRAMRAMFYGGFATFALLYDVQAVLPLLAAEFKLTPAAASTAVSCATAALALMLIPAGMLADRFGKKTVMTAALALAALFTLAAATAPNFQMLIVFRTLVGLSLAGLPAVAMAYLGDEIEAKSLGRAMGLYIAGNALGGMSGRYIAATISDFASWRVALAALGLLSAFAAYEFNRCLPPAKHSRKSAINFPELLRDARAHVTDGGLPLLFAVGFLVMGTFVSLYNYLGFHLKEAPFNLTTREMGAVFLLYIVGIWASTWTGRLADRVGRRNILWMMAIVIGLGLLMTLSGKLPIIILGVAIFTFGFFGAHSIASSWVGRRALKAKTLAASMYLGSYYLGASLIGSLSGLLWKMDGWVGVSAGLGGTTLACLVIALKLRTLAPVRRNESTGRIDLGEVFAKN